MALRLFRRLLTTEARTPRISSCAPVEMNLEEGKEYFWFVEGFTKLIERCKCGFSKKPFCDGSVR